MSELEGEHNKWITTRANDKAEISTLEGKDAAAVEHDNLLSLTPENSHNSHSNDAHVTWVLSQCC